jgi:nicotinamidase-related amidase
MPNLIEGRPALILIDIQKGGDGAIPSMDGRAERLANTMRVLDAARLACIPVIFFREVHRRNLIDFGRELDGVEKVHLLEGDRSSELVDELQPRDDEYIITKRRYSCFFGTDFEILLKGLNVDTLILLGGLTDVCVHYTFVDAHQHDYYARVVEDCCGGSNVARHEAALDAMEYLQTGARRTADEVIVAFGKWAPAAV